MASCWHNATHTRLGTALAELGEHQLTIRDHLRHSSLGATNQFLQAASKAKREAQAKLIEVILPVHLVHTETAGYGCTVIAPRFRKNQFLSH